MQPEQSNTIVFVAFVLMCLTFASLFLPLFLPSPLPPLPLSPSPPLSLSLYLFFTCVYVCATFWQRFSILATTSFPDSFQLRRSIYPSSVSHFSLWVCVSVVPLDAIDVPDRHSSNLLTQPPSFPYIERLRFDLNEFTGNIPTVINAPALGESFVVYWSVAAVIGTVTVACLPSS